MELVDYIKSSFTNTPYPGSRFIDISATKYDEGVYEYFVGSDNFDHDVKDLRYHSCALSFFTDAAFRYWLPAFMIAEVVDPVEADIIGESIAFHLSEAESASDRIKVFSEQELDAIKAFLTFCVSGSDPIYAAVYQKAVDTIEHVKQKAEQAAPSNR